MALARNDQIQYALGGALSHEDPQGCPPASAANGVRDATCSREANGSRDQSIENTSTSKSSFLSKITQALKLRSREAVACPIRTIPYPCLQWVFTHEPSGHTVRAPGTQY